MEPIRSPRNRAIVEAARLHRPRERRRLGRTLVEGPHVLEAMIVAGLEPRRMFALVEDIGRWPGATPVTSAVMERLAGTESPRGPVAVIDIPAPSLPTPDRHLIGLWEVSDPGNAGTIVRSAAAFGLGVVTGPGTTDVWSPKAIRAGAGGHFSTPIATVESLEDLDGWRIAALVVSGGTPPEMLGAGPWVLLVGPEPRGLDESMVSALDARVTIPMPGGLESLNAAVAASVVAHVLATRTTGRPPSGFSGA